MHLDDLTAEHSAWLQAMRIPLRTLHLPEFHSGRRPARAADPACAELAMTREMLAASEHTLQVSCYADSRLMSPRPCCLRAFRWNGVPQLQIAVAK